MFKICGFGTNPEKMPLKVMGAAWKLHIQTCNMDQAVSLWHHTHRCLLYAALELRG
jgi:hypothetical protein